MAKNKEEKINIKQLEEQDRSNAVLAIKDYSYPADALTPAKLAAALKEANKGNIAVQAEMFTDMIERDWDMGSAFATRRRKVAGLSYAITPADDSAQAKKAAESVDLLFAEYIGNFADCVHLMQSAVAFGFSVMEINWSLQDGLYWPISLVPIEQRYFTYSYDDKLLRYPRMLTLAQPEEGEELIPNKYIVHQPIGLSGLTVRDGLVRQCAYLYLFKNYDIKDWVSFMDRYGIPMRIGKYNEGTTKAQRDVLRRAVMGLGADAAAMISEGTLIELIETSGRGTDMFERFAEYASKSYNKVILGHTAATESTAGKLGNEQQASDLMQDLKDSDCRQLEQTLREQLIYPFCVINFGIDCPIPRIRFASDPEEDRELEARIISTLAGAGFTDIPLSHIHERFGIPVPLEGEQTLADLRPQQQQGSGFFGLNQHGKAAIPLAASPAQSKLSDMLPSMPLNEAMDAEMLDIMGAIFKLSTFAEVENYLKNKFPTWSEGRLTAVLEHAITLSELAGKAEDYTRGV